MFAGPLDDIRRIIKRSDIFNGGSACCDRECFTAKPTPYSCHSSSGFPYQRNVWFFSLIDPESARRVSCKAAKTL